MKGISAIAHVVEHGTTAEATLAVGTVFTEQIDTDAQLSPINDITKASELVNVFGLSWGRRVDGVIAVYDTHYTGMRLAYNPLHEIRVTEDMPEPRALTLALLKSIPISRPYLLSLVQENT